MQFDDILRRLGKFGRYQGLFLLLILLTKMQSTFVTMGIVFIAGVPEHWCNTPELNHLNLTVDVLKNLTLPLVEADGRLEYSSCSRFSHNYSSWTESDVWDRLNDGNKNESEENCVHGWTYDDSIYTSTIVSEWDLVCDKRWMIATGSSVYMAGYMVGVFLASSISDIIGRRPTFIFCFFGACAVGCSISFAPNYIVFCVMRFFSAMFSLGYGTCAFVIIMEITHPEYRSTVGMAHMIGWSVSTMVYAMFAYFIREWFILNVVTTSVMLPMVICSFFVPESPRWLYVHNRKEQANAILKEVAKCNGVELPEKFEIETKQAEKAYFWNLWNTRRLALRSSVVCYLWFVVSCVWFGLSLNTSNLGGNDFVNFSISAAVEIPSYILVISATQLIGRRWPMIISLLISGIPLLSIMAVPADMNWLIVTLAMIGKFGINASFTLAYVFSAELYPTVVRSVAVGTGSVFARIGGIVAPLINELGMYSQLIPLAIFGVMSLLAALLTLTLPETKGTSLPETLGDVHSVGRYGCCLTGLMN